MMCSLSTLVAMCLISQVSRSGDHKIGGGEDFPREVRVGDVIRFDRPAMGGRNIIEVRVNGKPVNGRLVMERMEGKALIGGGRVRFEARADEPGQMTIEITITPAGERSGTKNHVILVRK